MLIICYFSLDALRSGVGAIEVRRGGVYGEIVASFPLTMAGAEAAEALVRGER